MTERSQYNKHSALSAAIAVSTLWCACATHPPESSLPVADRLMPPEIQSRIRLHYGVFRECYESGLARAPALAGRVLIRFEIDRDGTVASVEDGGSELADGEVVSCILRESARIRFRASDGVTTAVYPISFTPG